MADPLIYFFEYVNRYIFIFENQLRKAFCMPLLGRAPNVTPVTVTKTLSSTFCLDVFIGSRFGQVNAFTFFLLQTKAFQPTEPKAEPKI